MKFTVSSFRGAVRRFAPRLLEPGVAQQATNCDVRDGDLRPFNRNRLEATLPKPGTIQTVFRWENQAWLHWADEVDVVNGPVPADTEGRVYWTGDGKPQMSYAGPITSSGDGVYPSNSYDLGVPVPASPPAVSVTGNPDDESDPEDERAYVYTYVTNKGEEGAPSDPSGIVTVQPGQSVDITGMLTGPGGNINLASKRIYRTVTDSDGSVSYRLVHEVTLATASYNDSKSGTQLGEILPSTEWDEPPEDLKGLIAMPGGFLLGFRDNELCPSVAFRPHAWPVGWRLQTEPDIVAIGAVGSTCIIGTKDYPYVAQGADPSTLTLVRGEDPAPCLSKRGMVDMGDVVAYPSTEGLIAFAGYEPRNVTEGVLTRKQWQWYNPASMLGGYFEDQYIGFFDNGSPGAIVIPLHGEWVIDLALPATATWTDPETGALYIVQNGTELREFDDQGEPEMTASWRSGEDVGGPRHYAVVRVIAANYPVTLRTYTDGNLRQTLDIPDGEPHWLEAGFLARRWSFGIETSNRVRFFEAADSIEELGIEELG